MAVKSTATPTQVLRIPERVIKDTVTAAGDDDLDTQIGVIAAARLDLSRNPLESRDGGATPPRVAEVVEKAAASVAPGRMFRLVIELPKLDRRAQPEIGYLRSALVSLSWDKLLGAFERGCERFCALKNQRSCPKECLDHLHYLQSIIVEMKKRPEIDDLTEVTALKLESLKAAVCADIAHYKSMAWIEEAYELDLPTFYENYDVLCLARSIAVCLGKDSDPSVEELAEFKKKAINLGMIFLRVTRFDIDKLAETGPTRKSYLEALAKAINDLSEDSPFKPRRLVKDVEEAVSRSGVTLGSHTPEEYYFPDFEIDINAVVVNLRLSCNYFNTIENCDVPPEEYGRVYEEIRGYFQSILNVLAKEEISPDLAFELERLRLGVYADLAKHQENGFFPEDFFVFIPVFYQNPSVHALRKDLAFACADPLVSLETAQDIKDRAQSLGAPFLEAIALPLDAPLDALEQRTAFLDALAQAIDALPEDSPFKPKSVQNAVEGSDHDSLDGSVGSDVVIPGFHEFFEYLDSNVGAVIGSGEHAAIMARLHVLKLAVAQPFQDQIHIVDDLSGTCDDVTEAYRKYRASMEDDELGKDGDV